MASIVGSASTVDGNASSGSTSVTVPADATAAVAFWSHFDGNIGSTLGTLTLGGNSFTIVEDLADGEITTDTCGTGVAVLTSLPGSGTQTLAWAWSAGGARAEGGGIIVVFVKDVDTANLVIDSGTDARTGGVATGTSVATEAGCLPIGMGQKFTDAPGGNPDLTGHDVLLVDNFVVAAEGMDVGYSTSFTNPENFSLGTPYYSSVAAISLRHGADTPPEEGPPFIIPFRVY